MELFLILALLLIVAALGLAYLFANRPSKALPPRSNSQAKAAEKEAKKEARAAKKTAKKEAEAAEKTAEKTAQKAADKAADKTPWDDFIFEEAYEDSEYSQLSDGQEARAEEQARTRAQEPRPRPAPPAPMAPPQVAPAPMPPAFVPPSNVEKAGGFYPVPSLPGMARLYEQWQFPEFSSFFPAAVQTGESYAFLIYIHIKDAAGQVREEAEKFGDLMGGKIKAASSKSQTPIPRGTALTFIPQAEGLRFSPDSQTILWGEGVMAKPYQTANFLFKAEGPFAGTVIAGQVLVMDGLLTVGAIPFQMQLKSQSGQSLQQGVGINLLDPVFASYSHQDSPVMEYFRARRADMGQKMLVDIYDLRAGEHWADRLLEMIDESAVFQLFWSDHSAASPYCRQEWEHALAQLASKPRFIQPIWWQAPMPPPPPELAALHFQKIDLPLILRLSQTARSLIRWR